VTGSVGINEKWWRRKQRRVLQPIWVWTSVNENACFDWIFFHKINKNKLSIYNGHYRNFVNTHFPLPTAEFHKVI